MNRKEKRKLDRLARNNGAASIETVLQTAVGEHQQGRLRQAEKKYRQILTAWPGHFDATHHLGILTYQKGEFDKAVRFFRKAIAIHPENDEAFHNLGMALAALNKIEDASQAFDQALDINPENAKAPFNAAVMLHEHGRPDEAVEKYRKAIAIDPDYATALINLGNVLMELDRFDEAETAYRRAIEARPDYAEAHCNLGVLLHDRGKQENSLAAFRTAIELAPDYGQALIYMGHLLHDMERLDEAIEVYRAGLSLDTMLPGVRVNLGDALRAKGDLEEAKDAYRQSIQLDADKGEAYRCLAELDKFAVGDPDIETMERLLEKTGKQGGKVLDLHYALVKAHQDTGNMDASFAHLAKANAIKRGAIQYDVADDVRRFERIADRLGKDRFIELTGGGCHSSEPIFIIGMPRSGTTLIEQILASHSQVHAGGEMTALSEVISAAAGRHETSAKFIDDLKFSDLSDMGKTYLEQAVMTGDGRKTDKMPANFIYAGLIHLILPNAKIIHCMRDPVDTCLSCLQRFFAKGQRFSYDQFELGTYYVAYDRLMRHWHDVLGKRMYRVRYEELIEDQEGETRRLLEYCGLPWEDACLRFQDTNRAVRTASAAQVRQPLYNSSVRRWLPCRRQLSDLLDTLGPLVE